MFLFNAAVEADLFSMGKSKRLIGNRENNTGLLCPLLSGLFYITPMDDRYRVETQTIVGNSCTFYSLGGHSYTQGRITPSLQSRLTKSSMGREGC